jgi:hypothetical protein
MDRGPTSAGLDSNPKEVAMDTALPLIGICAVVLSIVVARVVLVMTTVDDNDLSSPPVAQKHDNLLVGCELKL